ncbi:Ig-like domain-containing protein [Halomonas sabkhae]|uniref:Ig-like domain-containing protein n=1 Tax=Halomonas sabkhae TaxID=626223 RepID=UPI0025B5E8D5|nr:Ig-like domain-containing protein [Halomonas sabkhae]MDN3524811.1 Ig-like domain-containing protein [Halomonas sabkhae]
MVVNYTITDADGDTSDATLTITVAPDSEPEVEVPTDPSDPNEPSEPIDPDDPDLDDDPAAGDALYVVDEAGLPGGSDEAANSETVSGTLDIATGGDDLAAVRMTHKGDTTDVTGGGEITTGLGTLTVTENADGSYAWSYTLDTNSTDHSSDGTAADAVRELFDIQVEDSDGDTADSTLGIDVKDDVPTLSIDDTPATVTEGETVDGTWTTDSGADTPATVTVTAGGDTQTLDMSATTNSVTLNTDAGELTVNADQTWSFVANDNQDQASGTPSVDFTIATEDADTDTASDNHTIEITDGADPTPGDASGNGSTASLAVDDADTESTSSSTDTGTIAFTAGSDDLTSFTFGTTDPTVTGLASGETLSWTTNGDGDRVATLDSTGEQVLTLSLSNTGTIAAGTSGNVTVTATLAENLPHAASVDSLSISGVEVIAEDIDGGTATGSADIAVADDEPSAVDDSTDTAEDTPITYNVLTNGDGTSDTQGVDGATLTAASLADPSQGDVSIDPNGEVTFTPAGGVEGDVVVNYTITDADGDTSDATLTINVAPDSEPEVEVPTDPSDPNEPSEPIDPDDPDLNDDPAAGDALYVVDEAGLPDGSDEAANSETVSGTLDIATGGDDLAAVRMTHNGTTTDVTGGGEITTDLGTLTVTESGGSYSWTYTLDTNSTDHSSDGTAADAVRELFDIQVEDSDGDTADSTLGIDVKDDVPTLSIDDTPATVTEGETVDGTWTTDSGADTPATVTVTAGGTSQTLDMSATTNSVTLNIDEGELTVQADQTWSFVANDNQDQSGGPVPFDFTIETEDADTDTASDSHTIEITDGPGPGKPGDDPGIPVLRLKDEETLGGSSSSASVSVSFTAGSDDLTDFKFADTEPTVNQIASGETISWSTNDDGDRVATLDSTGEQVLTLSLSNTDTISAGTSGNVTVTATLTESLPHAIDTDFLYTSAGIDIIATDIDGDQDTQPVTVYVTDDEPTLNIVDTPATVTEGETVDGTWTTDSGADTPASVTVTAGGTSQTLDMSATTNSVTLNTGAGELTVQADQTWSFVANDNQDQASGTPSVTFTIDTEDADNDPASDNHTIEITDGAPPTPGDGSGAGDTANLAVDDADTEGPSSSTDTGTIAFTAGSDDLTSFTFGTTDPTVTGLASGETLSWTTNGDGDRVATLDSTDEEVLTLSLSNTGNIAAGTSGNVTVTATLAENLPHAASVDSLSISGVEVIAEDIDGGTATGSADIAVADDAPTLNIVDTPATVTEGETVDGTWTTDSGADTPASVTVTAGGAPQTLDMSDAANSVTLNTGAGELTVNADQTWSFVANDNQDQASGTPSVTFTIDTEDADNDPASDNHTIEITDGAPPTPGDGSGAGDSTSLSLADAATVGAASSSDNNTLTFTAGSDDLTSFAFGTTNPTVTGLASGESLTWSTNGAGDRVATLDSTGEQVLTLSLSNTGNIAAGTSGNVTVTATLAENLPHAASADSLSISGVEVIAEDIDGGTATGSVEIEVADDLPSAEIDDTPVTVEEGETIAGNWTMSSSADTPNVVTVRVDGEDKELDMSSTANSVAFTAPEGELTVNADQTWSFTANTNQDQTSNPSLGFRIQAEDADEDTDGDTLTITITDGADPTPGDGSTNSSTASLAVDDAETDGTASSTDTGTIAFTAGSDDLTSFAFGTTNPTVTGLASGESLTWSTNSSGQRVASLNGEQVLALTLSDTGTIAAGDSGSVTVEVEQFDALPHAMGGDALTISGVEVIAEDVDGDPTTGSVDIEVADDEPSAANDTASTGEEESVTVNVLANDDAGSDTPAVLTGATLVSGQGTVTTDAATGEVTFTPDAGYTGTAQIDYTMEDADGDEASAQLSVDVVPNQLVIGTGGDDPNLEGGGGNDVLIGDPGGTKTVIEPAEDYNIAIILDRSSSMGRYLSNGDTRFEGAQKAINAILEEFAAFSGTINLHINMYDESGFDEGIIQRDFGEFDGDKLSDAQDWVNDQDDGYGTYAQFGFDAATDWFSSQNNDAQNLAYFIADGTESSDSDLQAAQTAYQLMRLIADPIVEAIALDRTVDVEELKNFDTDGDVPVADTAEELTNILKGGSTMLEEADLGADILNGGAGDDILFGDSVDPGNLTGTDPDGDTVNGEPQSGYSGLIDFITEVDGAAPDDGRTLEFIKNNYEDLVNTARADGGGDTLNGQAGNDTLIATSGDDTLNGGAGDDQMLGGTGADIFAWTLNDGGTAAAPADDTVTDFGDGDDTLQLGELLEGYDGDQSALNDFINASYDGADTVLHIKTDGGIAADNGNADQVITLSGFSEHSGTSQEILQAMADSSQLDVD